jgi:hypothetical protein
MPKITTPNIELLGGPFDGQYVRQLMPEIMLLDDQSVVHEYTIGMLDGTLKYAYGGVAEFGDEEDGVPCPI